MNYSKSIEMYLETIYILESNHGHAHGVDIAERLDITKPSVSKAMNHLQKEGLISKEAYGHIVLTEKGKAIAKEIYCKHCLITGFLEKSLGLSSNEASINACRMEHIISDEMLKAISAYMGDESPE